MIEPEGGGGGDGGTTIFSNKRQLGSFLAVQNFEFQYYFGFSEKLSYFRVLRFCGSFWGQVVHTLLDATQGDV